MTKVYVVESGEYSDRYIVGVFSEENKEWAELAGRFGYVTEYEVDAEVEQLQQQEHGEEDDD